MDAHRRAKSPMDKSWVSEGVGDLPEIKERSKHDPSNPPPVDVEVKKQ